MRGHGEPSADALLEAMADADYRAIAEDAIALAGR